MPNKRTGEDYLDQKKPKQKKPTKPKKGWGGSRGGEPRYLSEEDKKDIREKIAKNKADRAKKRRILPAKY